MVRADDDQRRRLVPFNSNRKASKQTRCVTDENIHKRAKGNDGGRRRQFQVPTRREDSVLDRRQSTETTRRLVISMVVRKESANRFGQLVDVYWNNGRWVRVL